MRWRQSEGDDQVHCDLRDRGVPRGQRLDPHGALREVDQQDDGGAMSLSLKIREARRLVSMTQSELAQRIGVTRGTVTQWESDNPRVSTNPSPFNLGLIATNTGMPINYFIEEQILWHEAGALRSGVRVVASNGTVGEFVKERIRTKIMSTAYDFSDHENISGKEAYDAVKKMCGDVLELLTVRTL